MRQTNVDDSILLASCMRYHYQFVIPKGPPQHNQSLSFSDHTQFSLSSAELGYLLRVTVHHTQLPAAVRLVGTGFLGRPAEKDTTHCSPMKYTFLIVARSQQ